MDSLDLVHRKNKARAFEAGHEQTLATLRRVAIRKDLLEAEQTVQRDTNQQFAANVHQAKHNAQAPMRQRMNGPPLCDFLKYVGGQREPLRVDPKHDHGRSDWTRPVRLFGIVPRPLLAVRSE